ncbi:MAG: hypothetical protein ACJ798_15230 [Phenylobacterium sp.]
MSVLGIDRDRVHKERVDDIMKNFQNGDSTSLARLFVSENVDRSIYEEKLFLQSYNFEKILAYLPFHSTIYTIVCPYCIKKNDFARFSTLVERGAIVPTLIAPYSAYSEEIVDVVYNHDHISRYEYQAYRFLNITSDSKNRICAHCVGIWKDEAREIVSSTPELKRFKSYVQRLASNIHPFVAPDWEILEEFKSALVDKDVAKLKQVAELSDVIYALRTARAFNAPLLVDNRPLTSLPTGLTSQIDEAVSTSAALEREVASGLGLTIPVDIPVESYIEIARSLRPQIRSVVDRVVASSGSSRSETGPAAIAKEVMKVNAEVERIKSSGRQMVLDACVDFYSKNSPFVNVALVAGAFGLAGGIAGCIGGPSVAAGVGAVASGVTTVARKKKWIAPSPAVERLGRAVETGMQPFIDKLVSAYVGAATPTVNVMSLRTRIDGRAVSARAKARKQPAIASPRSCR